MNKLLTKIVGAALGLTMTIGVGVAVASNQGSFSKAEAAGKNDWLSNEITSTSGLNATDKYVFATSNTNGTSGSYFNGTVDSNPHWQVSAFGDNAPASDSAAGVIQLVSVSTDVWKIKLVSTDKFVTATKAGTKGSKVNASSDSYGWYFYYTNNTGWNAVYQEAFSSKYACFRDYQNGSFRSYQAQSSTVASTSGNAFKIFKYAAGKTLSSVAVTTAPAKTTYYVGDSFDSTGMVVTATYSNSTTADVTSSCTFSPETFSSTGNQNVTVSYTEGGVTKTTTQAVTVNAARTMQSISLHGTIAKDDYYVGDAWDLTGLDIQVNWSVGDPTYVALDDPSVLYACTPTTATSTSITSFDIEIIFDEFDETFSVSGLTVSEHPLADIIDGTTVPAAAIGSSTSTWGTASTFSDYTGAVYTARFMGPSGSPYFGRLNDSVNGFIYTSSLPTALRLKSVTIDAIAASKSVCVFAQNEAYDGAPSAKGDAIVTLTPEKLSYTFEGSYKAICIRGAASSCDIGKVTIEYESAAPVIEYAAGGSTANLHVVNGSTNSVTINTDNFESVSAGLFSNSPTNSNSTKANLSYSVSGTVVTVTATGKAVGEESFTISATGCSNTLTLNVTVQASTTFDSLVISTATTDLEFNEDDPFSVTGMVVTANFTVGGSPATETFAASDADHLLTALSFTVGGSPISIGDPLSTTGNSVTVGVSYTDGTTGTTKSTSYTIKVNAYVAHTYTKVTSAPADWRGTYLLGFEKEGTLYVFNSTLETFDVTFNTVNTTSISGDAVTGSKEIDKAAVKIERNTVSGTSYYHALCGNGKYLKSASKGISYQNTATAAVAVTFDGVSLKIGDYWLRFNGAVDQMRFRFGDSSYLSSSTASLYKMDATAAINTEVSNFVSGFDSAVGGVCDYDGLDTNVSALNSAWTAQATAFKSLSVDAQGILANTTYTHDAETAGSTADIIDRYDYVYGKYSASLTKGDFMNRADAGTLVSYSSPRIDLLGVSDNTNAIVIVVITSMLGLTAIGGYFFLRKRKEQ